MIMNQVVSQGKRPPGNLSCGGDYGCTWFEDEDVMLQTDVFTLKIDDFLLKNDEFSIGK